MAIKKINYNGSSKVIIRLCEVVNDLIDRGGGGHTIQNSSGTDMTARTNLQFTGASVSDDAVNDRTVVDVPTYTDATQSASGLMSASDKTKLDGIASGAEVNVQPDWNEADNTADDYIKNKPTIPTALADLSEDTTHRVVTDTEKTTWSGKVSDNPAFSEAATRANIASGESFATILGKIKKFFSDLKTVAFTGAYADLTGQPTIPTVNDATLTLTQGGSTLGTFTANAASNVTIDVPSAGSPSASSVSYDNTGSGMTASNVQDAIDELCTDVSGKVSKSGDTMSGNLTINRQNGTSDTVGVSQIILGNDISVGTAGNSIGALTMYGDGSNRVSLQARNATGNKTIQLPDASGTVALSEVNNNFTANQVIATSNTGTSSVLSRLVLGTSIPDGTTGATHGRLEIFGTGSQSTRITATNTSTQRDIALPDASGTVALTSDISTYSYYRVGSTSGGAKYTITFDSTSNFALISLKHSNATTDNHIVLMFMSGYVIVLSQNGTYVTVGNTTGTSIEITITARHHIFGMFANVPFTVSWVTPS